MRFGRGGNKKSVIYGGRAIFGGGRDFQHAQHVNVSGCGNGATDTSGLSVASLQSQKRESCFAV